MKSSITVVFAVVFIFTGFFAQAQVSFTGHEDSLKVMARSLPLPEHDFERLSLNHDFKTYFEKVLQKEGSMDYPFDSLNTVSILKAPDGSFRIISWYVPLSDNSFEYFGFFQSYDTHRGVYQLYTLTDRAKEAEDPRFETFDHENWYGAYYSELVHERHRRNDYYVLLGWRADSQLTRKRIIEPVRLMGQGRPAFGNPVFRFDNNRHRRIIFEYSARVSMSIRYEAHPIEQGRRPANMIIFDRMAPTHSFLKGHYQFYKPETNIFDAFIFDEGKWVFMEDIDARNPRRRPPPRPVPPQEN